jgi:hypothetical protein
MAADKRYVVNIMARLLYPRKETWYPLNRRQTEPHSHSGDLEKRKISCPKEKSTLFH